MRSVKKQKVRKKKIGFIYEIRCKVNGKGYVGQHVGFRCEDRWEGHYRDAYGPKPSMYPIHCALRLHGFEAFTWEVIWTEPVSQLNKMERQFVKERGTFIGDGQGYNLTRGGDGVRGLQHSVESRTKMTTSQKERWAKMPAEERAAFVRRVSETTSLAWQDDDYRAATGRAISRAIAQRSPEERARIAALVSKAALERAADPAYCKKLSKAQKKSYAAREKPRVWSDAVKAKMAVSASKAWADPSKRANVMAALVPAVQRGTKRFWSDPANRAGACASMVLRRADPEYRKRLSDSQTKRLANPEVRKQLSDSVARLWQDPAYRARMCAAMKKRGERQRAERAASNNGT